MAGELWDLEVYQKKKKTIVVIGAVLVVLLGGTLIIGQPGGLIETETPSPSAVAVITTAPPPTSTATSQPTATHTSIPPAVTPTETLPGATSTPTPTPTDTTSPSTPTPTATDTVPPPTPTPSPSPTPEPPTPTPSPSPTPTPTATPLPSVVPVIEHPLDGSELPAEGLVVQGTAAPGTTVRVYEGDVSLGEAQVNEAGNWSLVPVEQLDVGDHTIVAVDIVTGATSLPVTFTVVESLLPITGDQGIPVPSHRQPEWDSHDR